MSPRVQIFLDANSSPAGGGCHCQSLGPLTNGGDALQERAPRHAKSSAKPEAVTTDSSGVGPEYTLQHFVEPRSCRNSCSIAVIQSSESLDIARSVAVVATRAAGVSTPSPPRAFASRATLVFAFLWSLFSARAAYAFLACSRCSLRSTDPPCRGAYARTTVLSASKNARYIIISMPTELHFFSGSAR
jgi:hypothetical protein